MIEILESRIAPAVVATGAIQLGGDSQAANLVAVDASGNSYVAGHFTGVFGIQGSSLISSGDPVGDVFIAKFDSDMDLLWLQSWGGAGLEEATALLVDTNGDLFVTGQFSSANAGFGGTGTLTANNNQSHGFLLKVDGTTGNGVAAFDGDGQLKFGNGLNPSAGTALAFNTDGRLYFGGNLTGSNHGLNGSGGFSASDPAGFIVRLNQTTGAMDTAFAGFVVQIDETSFNSLFSLSVDSAGNVYAGTKLVAMDDGTVSHKLLRISAPNYFPDATYGQFGVVDLSTGDVDVAVLLDHTGQMMVAVASGTTLTVNRLRFDGLLDQFFIPINLDVAASSASLAETLEGEVYIAGHTLGKKNYLVRIGEDSRLDFDFGKNGVALFGAPAVSSAKVGIAAEPGGKVMIRDFYTGRPDLDPGKGVTKLAASSALRGGAEGFLLSLDGRAVAAGQTIVIQGPFDGDSGRQAIITIKLTGPGYAHIKEGLVGGNFSGPGSLESIELFNTTLASKLTVSVKMPVGGMSLGRIFTHDPLQHIGSIVVGTGYFIGGGASGGAPDVLVTGKINNLVLPAVQGDTIIKLGQDLPYNAPGSKTPDTYNHRPNLTIAGILGPGVLIDVTGDGTPGGIGGGGFGKVVIGNWAFEGLLRTTQSIKSFKISTGDFFAHLEVDKFHVGEETTANVGSMTVQDGSWGSSGTEIEGTVGSFSAEAFLAMAEIKAGSIGKINMGEGGFNGTLTLTDEQAKGVASLTVNSDFTGKIVSDAPLKRLNIRGDFLGSLTAPSIAAITAFSFRGATTGDTVGDPNKLDIITTAGLLGQIRATAGPIDDFDIHSAGNFTGIKVSLKKLESSVNGLSNVSITANNLGPISVDLSAKKTAPDVNLTGIVDSSFTATAGKIGNVTVKISAASGASYGLDNAFFEAAASIGNVTVNVAKGTAATALARAVDDASLVAGTTIGAVNILGNATSAQAAGLELWAGGRIAKVSVKSKTAAFGTLEGGAILAGQNFNTVNLTDSVVKRIAAATLGAVAIGGSLNNTTIAAGGPVTSVSVGDAMSKSYVLAGAVLGGNRAIGGGDDIYYRTGVIGTVKVKGAFDSSTLSAGIATTDAIFGNADDTIGVAVDGAAVVAAIKSVTLGPATVSATPPVLFHVHAIQSIDIGKLRVGRETYTDFTIPAGAPGSHWIDAAPAGTEGPEDVLVRIFPPT